MSATRLKQRWPIIFSCAVGLASMDYLIAPSPVAACFLGFGCESRSVGKARGATPGKARRDSDVCKSTDLPLSALVPNTDETFKTSITHPTFWFYLPELKPIVATGSPKKSEIKLKFVLQDEQHNDIYQTRFQLPENPTSGVIGLRFLTSKAALEIGKKYRWYFLMYCNDPDEIYEPTFVEGLIQREPLSTDRQAQLDRETPQQRVLTYAETGLWYDTLTALDQISSLPDTTTISKNDIKITWSKLLQGVGLPAPIAQQPIIGHYYVEN